MNKYNRKNKEQGENKATQQPPAVRNGLLGHAHHFDEGSDWKV